MKLFALLALAVTGCANLSEVRFGWDFTRNTMTVSVPLSKPTSSK